jgi:hypothetical protein
MQVWADIYPFTPTYAYRIVIDTIRNQFTVVDPNNKVISYQPTTVAYDVSNRVYMVSDIPTRPGVVGNIMFTVTEVPPYIEIVGGFGSYGYVVYANGYKVGEKPSGWLNWGRTGAFVPPPNPLEVPELAYYETILRTNVYVVR